MRPAAAAQPWLRSVNWIAVTAGSVAAADAWPVQPPAASVVGPEAVAGAAAAVVGWPSARCAEEAVAQPASRPAVPSVASAGKASLRYPEAARGAVCLLVCMNGISFVTVLSSRHWGSGLPASRAVTGRRVRC